MPEQLYWYYQNPNSLQRVDALIPKKLYFNTMYRFRMLDYLSKKGKEEKFRAWILDYGYRQMLDRRDIERGTEYESKFNELARDILKTTGKDFRSNRNISVKKKAKFYFFWKYPGLAGFYAGVRYGRKR